MAHYEYIPDLDADEIEGAPTRIETMTALGLDQPAEPEPAERPFFEVIGGNDRGKEFTLGQGDHTIGRSLDNEVVLADIAVSRKHTLVCEENGLFVLRDLGSGNGTLVNGQKVHTYHLKDGDQIELGNTLMRFRLPVSHLADAETRLTHIADAPGQRPQAMPQPMPATARSGAGPGSLGTGATMAGRRGISRRQKLLLYGGGGVCVFLLLAVAIKVVVGRKPANPPQPAVNASAEAAKHLALGMKYARERDWEQARLHCQRVYLLAPGLERAKSCAKSASLEIKARAALKQAETLLLDKAFAVARGELAKIPSSSVYAIDARDLKRRIDDKQVEELIAETKRLEAAKDHAGALAKLKEARKVAPTNGALQQLYEQLSASAAVVASAGSAGAPSRANRSPRSRRVRRHSNPPRRTQQRQPQGGSAAIWANYRRRNFSGAEGGLRALSSRLRGRRKAQTLKMAGAVATVGRLWQQAEELQARAPGQAMVLYQRAITADAQLPGKPHSARLRAKLLQVARIQANSAVAAGRWSAAYQAYRLARSSGASAAQLQPILSKLEAKAMSIFEKGYTLRTSKPRSAKQLWQQVLRMVPPSSSAYQKSYRWLNMRAGGSQDEDEE